MFVESYDKLYVCLELQSLLKNFNDPALKYGILIKLQETISKNWAMHCTFYLHRFTLIGAGYFSERNIWIGIHRTNDVCGCSCGCPCDCGDVTDNECAACRDLWSWSDGSAVSWHSWRDGEPNGIFDCGALAIDAWIAENCDLEMRFLCEKGNRAFFFL